MLRIGMQAPEFEIPAHTGTPFRISDHIGKHPIVLFFFPSHARWEEHKELEMMTAHLRAIQEHEALLVGISNGSLEEVRNQAERLGASLLLCSDEDLSVCRSYRVLWLRSMGIRRVTYVIDRHGIIRGVAHHELLLERHWTRIDRVLHEISRRSDIPVEPTKADDA